MSTFIYESDALAQILNKEETVKVKVDLDIIATKTVKYDTPFGPSYVWSHELLKTNSIECEIELPLSDMQKTYVLINAWRFYFEYDFFKKEVTAEIENFMKGMC